MEIIYGPKGTGKTKQIIERANNVLDEAKGHALFITDTKRYTYDLKYQIKFHDVTGYGINSEEEFRGFLKGIVVASGDNEYVFLDGIARICGKPLSELGSIFEVLEQLEDGYDVKFVITCSAAKEDLPEFVVKHLN